MSVVPRLCRTGRSARSALIGACAGLALAPGFARAGSFSISTATVGTVDAAAWMGNSSSPYGRAMNGNSFETQTITTYNGYEYTGYWKNVSNAGHLAIARRVIGSTTWSVADLGNVISNGPNDAHNIVSIGIDPTDGTIHTIYDLHNNTLRYRVSDAGVANSPPATWDATSFDSVEQSTLLGSAPPSSLSYPYFIRTPGSAGAPAGDLQLFIRSGGSGAGSLYAFKYSGTSHTWDAGHQIDDGLVGTYVGTTTTSSPNRNDYPNGFNYGSDGKLYHTFTYRENATGAANHDLMFTYSEDGGATWKNNAGTVIANQATSTRWSLNSPGLVVRPLPESQTMMNQNGQAVDHSNYIHSINWHRDSAKDPSLNNVWEPQESSYYDAWRDNLGNWHENRIFGDVGTRPKILFDANDNAYAIYQVKSDTPALVGGAGSNGNLYFNNGDLVIAAATKATNWTDWKVIKTEAGPFVSEAQADSERLASTGSLSVVMQNSPTLTGNQGTTLSSFDYALSMTPAASTSFSANANWNSAGNWSGAAVPGLNTVVNINNSRTATVNTSVGSLDNVLAIGSNGSGGSLTVAAGGTLNLLQSSAITLSGTTSHTSKATYNIVSGGQIVVGRDAGAVGTYNQTGGVVSAWRFAVGDYFSETSGGGASTANISGGSLTTYELDVAFSANGSSSGSSFNQSGGTVTVNGDAILGEFGNTATLTLSGGKLTVAGDIREGFNQTNNGNFRMDGGTLDMTSNYITVDNFIFNGGTIQNVSTAPTSTNLNATAAAAISGMTVGTVLIGRDLSAGSTTILNLPAGVRLGAKRIEIWPGSGLGLASATSAVSIGGASFTANQVTISAGGVLAGSGLVNAAVNNNGGTISPGNSGIGNLQFASTFTQNPFGTLEIELGGAGCDQLTVVGAATLSGAIRVKTFGGFTPLPGQSFPVMQFGSRSGDLALSNQTGFAGLIFNKSYTATGLSLLASAQYIGDANLDGLVNSLDFNALAGNFNASGITWLGGDFNGDGMVNALDFNAIASNFGAGLPGPPVGNALAPEPAAGTILFSLLAARRRRR